MKTFNTISSIAQISSTKDSPFSKLLELLPTFHERGNSLTDSTNILLLYSVIEYVTSPKRYDNPLIF